MQITLVEQDIRNREVALKRCEYNLGYFRNSPKVAEYQEEIRITSQEAFYLQDQLEHYYVLLNLLREDQPLYDEMPPKV